MGAGDEPGKHAEERPGNSGIYKEVWKGAQGPLPVRELHSSSQSLALMSDFPASSLQTDAEARRSSRGTLGRRRGGEDPYPYPYSMN